LQKITPFLWFDNQAEEAMKFYASIFKNSRIENLTGSEVEPGSQGSIQVFSFQLEGQEFMALNGGPHFTFSPAISLFANCETQEEVDEFWEKLSEGGEKGQCGWLKDKYGLSWQIVPTALGELMSDKDPEKARRVMNAMLQMTKIDIAILRRAYEQGEGEY
jgi:predicted 3-demethylubiquinone-9 3-methyltransferase (glyoxalase superfamily)